MKEVTHEIVDLLAESGVGTDDWGLECDHFYRTTNGYLEAVYWMDFCLLHGDSDRGWDDEEDDYLRNEKEQIIYEFKNIKTRIDNILKVLEE